MDVSYSEHFPEYTLLEELGSGSYGIVYKVMDANNNVMAMKIPNGKSLRSDIEREIYFLNLLSDIPSFPRLIGTFERSVPTRYGSMYEGVVILMEYISGTPIDRVRSFTQKRAREVIKDISVTVLELHRRGILHMDLQPRNIMITDTGDVRIIDLGVSCFLEGTSYPCSSIHPFGLTSRGMKDRDVLKLITSFVAILRNTYPHDTNVARVNEYLVKQAWLLKTEERSQGLSAKRPRPSGTEERDRNMLLEDILEQLFQLMDRYLND